MIHPDTCLTYISAEVGMGVFATKRIPKGTITWTHDRLDRRFTPKQLSELGPLFAETMETYSYRDRRGDYVFCWDNARFVNHSFNANCLTTAYDFEIAIRDIEVGEELTDDYGYLNIDEPFEPLQEAGSERRVVYPDDLLKFHAEWDALLEPAFEDITRVDQPLRSLIKDSLWEQIEEIVQGKTKMASILSCYYDRTRELE